MELIQSPELPAPAGHYSQAVVTRGGLRGARWLGLSLGRAVLARGAGGAAFVARLTGRAAGLVIAGVGRLRRSDFDRRCLMRCFSEAA